MSRVVIPIDAGGGRGGVAACMSWTQGPATQYRPPPREEVSRAEYRPPPREVTRPAEYRPPHRELTRPAEYVREVCANTARALGVDSESTRRAEAGRVPHKPLPPGEQEQVVVTGRYTRRSPVPPPRLDDSHRTLYDSRRPPTPLRDGQGTERREAWMEHTPHPPPPHPHAETHRPHTYRQHEAPFNATKSYLEKYVNRSLSEREINDIVQDIRSDLNHAADDEYIRQRLLSMKRPPEKYIDKPYKSMLRYDRNGSRKCEPYDDGESRYDVHQPTGIGYTARDLYAPRAPETANPRTYPSSYQPRRPSTAHPHNHKQVTWDVTPRTVSSYPSGSYIDKSNGKHLSSWRGDKWNPDGTSYDDLVRLAAKYETRRHDNHKTRAPGEIHYNSSISSRERDGKVLERVVDKQGKVNVQLDCPRDSDLNVNVRVQSRTGSRYN